MGPALTAAELAQLYPHLETWKRVQSGWTEWSPPLKGSDWERIVIDLCRPVVNR